MGAYYIGIILICRIFQHICNKNVSNKIKSFSSFLKYSSFSNILSGLLAFGCIFINKKGFECDFVTLAVSAFSGIMLTLSTGFGIYALKSGTVAISSMFATAGLIIPCVGGIFIFKQTLSVWQWLCILLFFVSTYFLITASKKIHSDFSFKTILLLLGSMFSNGFVMLSQQLFAHLRPNGNVSVFSFLSFGILGIVLLIFSLFYDITKKEDFKKTMPEKNVLAFGAVLSVAVFIINQFATLAASIVPSVVLFSFINGGSTIIGAVVAAIFFKEPLNFRSIFGITLGISSLILIKAL